MHSCCLFIDIEEKGAGSCYVIGELKATQLVNDRANICP